MGDKPERSLFSLPPSTFFASKDDPAAGAAGSASGLMGYDAGSSTVESVYRALGISDMKDDETSPTGAGAAAAMAASLASLEKPMMFGTPVAPALIPGSDIPLPREIAHELFRLYKEDPWHEIVPESEDWTDILSENPRAFVVRLKTLVAEEDPNTMIEVLFGGLKSGVMEEPAVDVVAKFSELSVAESSPIRFETHILFVYKDPEDYDVTRFDKLLKTFLPASNHPYATIEFLNSFLTRRKFASGAITGEEAMAVLKQHITDKLPCSSLFLKLSAHYPEECLKLLEQLTEVDKSLPLTHLGERSLHKLAVSVVNKQETLEGSLRKAIGILKIGVDPRDWGYVAFNTLMRLAQEEDDILRKKDSKAASQVDLLLSLISVSNLDCLDRTALLMMAGKIPEENKDKEAEKAYQRINSICNSRKDQVSNEDLQFLLDFLDQDSTSSTHLVSIVLRKCVDNSTFNCGWKIASRMNAISKQVFGEVVTLCSKAYFASLKRPSISSSGMLAAAAAAAANPGDVWFKRIRWCVERHLPFLNRYPCGLALHVCAHRRDFATCWRWYASMREQLAFRLTGYHTSAVLKAASFEDNPDIEKIKDAYEMTPASERTTFTFIPLVRVWEAVPAPQKAKDIEFWNTISADIGKCLEQYASGSFEGMGDDPTTGGSSSEAQLEKVIQRLRHWVENWDSWKKATSNGTSIPSHMMRRKSTKSTATESGASTPSRSRSRRGSRKRDDSATVPIPSMDSSPSPSPSPGPPKSRGSRSSERDKDLSESFLTRRFSDSHDILRGGIAGVPSVPGPSALRPWADASAPPAGVIGSGRSEKRSSSSGYRAVAAAPSAEAFATGVSERLRAPTRSAPSSRHGSFSTEASGSRGPSEEPKPKGSSRRGSREVGGRS